MQLLPILRSMQVALKSRKTCCNCRWTLKKKKIIPIRTNLDKFRPIWTSVDPSKQVLNESIKWKNENSCDITINVIITEDILCVIVAGPYSKKCPFREFFCP